MADKSLGTEYFRELYAKSDDPWELGTNPYELAKYEKTIELLAGLQFERALEIGCAIGLLTERLAPRCEELLAVDISERALALAAARCAGHLNVRFRQARIPREFPSGPFDFILLSEVGYYWSDDDLAETRKRVAENASGGRIELVHYLPRVADYVRDGDSVHEAFVRDPRFSIVRSLRAARYRIDVLDVA